MRRALLLASLLVLVACRSRQDKAQDAVIEGGAKLEAKDLDGADAAFVRALEFVPDHPIATAGRGKVALAKGDAERARSLLAKCNDPACVEVRAEAAKTIRDRLAAGSLEGADGAKLIDLASEAAQDKSCGLLYALVQIEERDKKSAPAPASFIDEVKRRIDADAVTTGGDEILGGERLARTAGKALRGMTTCGELQSAEREMESSFQNVVALTGAGQGSPAQRSRILRSYALRAVLARVTKTQPPLDPDDIIDAGSVPW